MIEANTLSSILKTEVMPSAILFQTQLAEAVSATNAAGADCAATRELLHKHIEGVNTLQACIKTLEEARSRTYANCEKEMKGRRDHLVPAMEAARAASDELEQSIPRELWTLPTYAEMLLIR